MLFDRTRIFRLALLGIVGCGGGVDPWEIWRRGTGGEGHGGAGPARDAATADATPTTPEGGPSDAAPSDAREEAGDAGDGGPSFEACELLTGEPRAIGRCVPAAPFAWVGPGRLLTADSLEKLAPCGGATAEELETGSVLADQPPTCQGCTCDAPRDLKCGLGSASDYYFDEACVEPCSAACVNCGRSCVSTQSSCAFHGTTAKHLALRPAALVEGSCRPSPPPAPPPVALARAGRACVGSGGPAGLFCAPGRACASVQDPGSICLFHRGEDLACPKGPYTERTVFHGHIDDTRACAACSCGQPAGVTCPSRIEVQASLSCSNQALDVFDTTTDCLDLDVFKDPGGGSVRGGAFDFLPADPVGQGACAASGVASGAVAASEPFTACCIPEGTAVR